MIGHVDHEAMPRSCPGGPLIDGHGDPAPDAALSSTPAGAPQGFLVSHLFTERLRDQVAHDGEGMIKAVRVTTRGDLAGGCNFIDYVELPPGTSIGEHEHGVDEEEFYLVLSGCGLMRLGAARLPVGPGDLLRNPPGGVHGLANTGATTLKLVVFELSVPRKVLADD